MIEYLQCTISNTEYVNAALEIYTNSFPSNERHPINVIKERITNCKSILYIGRKNNQVICFALIYKLFNSDFVLLDYFAVNQNYRNEGIGTKFYNYLLNETSKLEKFLILEVEKPANKFDTVKIKRVEFYLKNKTYIIKDTPYILPALDSTTNTEMILMIGEGEKCKVLNEIKIKKLIKQIYLELYHIDENNILLLSFINFVPKSIKLTKKLNYD